MPNPAISDNTAKPDPNALLPDPEHAPERKTSQAPRILVVEDEFFVSLEIESAFTGAGYNVVAVASSAEEAEHYATSERPDLIVMDIRLLGQRDGIDAALRIFRQSGTRAIFATAHGDAQTRARAAPAQPLGWLAKPYTMESLIECVRRALKELKN
jgi:two-component system, response regulator PdtaR